MTRNWKNYPLKAILSAMFLHYLAYIVMQTMALLSETRRGPMLPDLILDHFPADRSFDWINSSFWLNALLFSILLLALLRPVACINYLRVGALVSLARGVFISLTTLGPPAGIAEYTPKFFLTFNLNDVTLDLLLRQWFPVDILHGGSGLSAVYLSQDLFFSGHTATTFLLLLVVKRRDPLFYLFLAYHIVTVVFLFVTHEHYSIDVLGAYFITYAIYRWSEGRILKVK